MYTLVCHIYIYIYTYVCVYVYIYLSLSLYIYIYIYAYRQVDLCTYLCHYVDTHCTLHGGSARGAKAIDRTNTTTKQNTHTIHKQQ